MHLVVLIFAGLCLLTGLSLKVGSFHTDNGLELLFRQRTQSDWEDVWHRETHSRCRHKLAEHLYWACEKDIYRVTRGAKPKIKASENKTPLNWNDFKWLNETEATTLLRSRRKHSARSSITSECCTKIGCTWEEYAEYCPSNKRRNHF